VKARSAIEGIRMKSSADSITVGRKISLRGYRRVSPCVRNGSACERMTVMQEREPTWNLGALTSLQEKLIRGAEHEPDSNGHSVDGDDPLCSSVGRETNLTRSSISARPTQDLGTWIVVPA